AQGQVPLRGEAPRARGVGIGARHVAEEPIHVRADATPHLDDVADARLARRRAGGNVQHAEHLDAVAEVPAAGIHPEGVGVGEAHAGAEPPAPAPARRGGVVDGEVLPGPEDERRAPARAGRGAEADAGLDRCAPVVAERRMLLLASAELVLHRRRDEREVVEAAEIGASETRRLELAAEERHRDRPHPVELAAEALGLQLPQALERHGLDVRIVVAAVPAHALTLRSTIASLNRGGAAASGISASGTSSTSMWISTVAFSRSATARASASGSAGARTVPARRRA